MFLRARDVGDLAPFDSGGGGVDVAVRIPPASAATLPITALITANAAHGAPNRNRMTAASPATLRGLLIVVLEREMAVQRGAA